MMNPELPFPLIDPQGWVQSREYALRNFNITVEDFLKKGNESLKWLREADYKLLDNDYYSSEIRTVIGCTLLSNWLAHHYLHLRQVQKLKYDYLTFSSGEKPDYTGSW
jgi:hypothetical protein